MIKKLTVLRIMMSFFLCFSWIIQKDAQAKHVAAIFYKIIEQSENQIMCSLCKHNCMVNKQQMTDGVLNNHWYNEYYYNTLDLEHKFCRDCFYHRCLRFHLELIGSKLKTMNWSGHVTDLSKYSGIGLVLKVYYGDSAAKCLFCDSELVQNFLDPQSGFCIAKCSCCPKHFHRDCVPVNYETALPQWVVEWKCIRKMKRWECTQKMTRDKHVYFKAKLVSYYEEVTKEIIEMNRRRNLDDAKLVFDKDVLNRLRKANFKDDFLEKYNSSDTDEKFNMMRTYCLGK